MIQTTEEHYLNYLAAHPTATPRTYTLEGQIATGIEWISGQTIIAKAHYRQASRRHKVIRSFYIKEIQP